MTETETSSALCETSELEDLIKRGRQCLVIRSNSTTTTRTTGLGILIADRSLERAAG
jgi:hypothetical protein